MPCVQKVLGSGLALLLLCGPVAGPAFAQEAPPAPLLDTITTRDGDVLVGSVQTGEVGGRLLLKGPQFLSEVKVLMSAVGAISLHASQREPAQDALVLTNGDRLQGRLVSITPDAVTMETQAAGPLTVRRSLVQAIYPQRKLEAVLDLNFAEGGMGPFKPMAGAWEIRDGSLACVSGSQPAFMSARLDQQGPMTCVLDFARAAVGDGVVLFTADQRVSPSEGIVVQIMADSVQTVRFLRGRPQPIAGHGGIRLANTPARLRIAYDPDSAKLGLWINEQFLSETVISAPLKSGAYINLLSAGGMALRRVTVLKGIQPAQEGAVQAAAEEDTVVFVNNGRIQAQEIGFSDGKFAIKTGFGVITPDAAEVLAIVLRTRGQTAVEGPATATIAIGAQTRISAEFKSLTAEALTVTCPYLGGVTIKRPYVSGIEFTPGR